MAKKLGNIFFAAPCSCTVDCGCYCAHGSRLV